MRYGLFIIGLVALAAPAQAESRLAYVTMVLQAFAAKVECPGTDVVYQDLVQKAQEMLKVCHIETGRHFERYRDTFAKNEIRAAQYPRNATQELKIDTPEGLLGHP